MENLPYWSTDVDLLELLVPYGTVLSVNIIPDPTRHSPSTGVVEMATEEDAERAIQALDGSEYLGYRLRVERRQGSKGSVS